MPSSSTTVDERLRALLLDGDFGRTGRLPSEREMAEELGVSRPALREALRKVVELGLVEVRRGAGAYLTAVDLSELAAVRLQLEPFAAALAAECRGDGDVRALRALVAQLAGAIDDPAAFGAADTRLHARIAEAGGNRVLVRTLARLAELASYSRATTAGDPRLRRRTLEHLTALVDLIAAGDPEGAADRMRRHLADVGAALAPALTEDAA